MQLHLAHTWNMPVHAITCVHAWMPVCVCVCVNTRLCLHVCLRFHVTEKMDVTVKTMHDLVELFSRHKPPEWFRSFMVFSQGVHLQQIYLPLVDKYISVGANVFLGTRRSTFSADILRMRRHEGVDSCLDGAVL